MADQTIDQENTSQVEEQQQESEEQVYQNCVLFPSQIQAVWESQDPNQDVQQHLLKYLERISESHEKQYQDWNEFENRYEPQELKWLADYILHNLVFLKENLKLEDDVTIAETLHIFWDALALFQVEEEIKDACAFRFEKIKQGLTDLFAQKKLKKAQVQEVLDFARKTLFSHLYLYIACLKDKQTQRRKRVAVNMEIPKNKVNSAIGDLETECKEIIETVPEDAAADDQEEGANDAEEEEAQQEDEEEEDPFDPDEPLYGIDQRLRDLDLDDESRRIIKEKLLSANDMIKQNLEERQTNFDAKLQQNTKKR